MAKMVQYSFIKEKIFMKWMIIFAFLSLLHAEVIEKTWYTPKVNTSWQWQLTGTLNLNYNVEIYDVDLFDTSKKTIRLLHKKGKKVICYLSAGSYENWRADAHQFSEAMKGKKMDGWDELWLDIRNPQLKSIMSARIKLAQEKGCDGIEADNIDGYVNESGFPLTAKEQLDYNKFLASQAHKRGLSIGLKNDLDQIKKLVNIYDFAINEQCHEYDECDKLKPFIEQNKAVLNVEYTQKYKNNFQGARDNLCANAQKEQFSTLIMPYDLDDSFRYSCD